MTVLAQGKPAMYPATYNRRFFASKLGFAAVVSIAAMAAVNVFALTQQVGMTADTVLVTTQLVELA
jgi:hypothetical protein